MLPVAWLLERRQWWAARDPAGDVAAARSCSCPPRSTRCSSGSDSSGRSLVEVAAPAPRARRRPCPSRRRLAMTSARMHLAPDRPGRSGPARDPRRGRLLVVPDLDRRPAGRRPRSTGRPIPDNLYPHPRTRGEHNGYNYSPAFEFVVGWWRWLPFEVFVAIWRADPAGAAGLDGRAVHDLRAVHGPGRVRDQRRATSRSCSRRRSSSASGSRPSWAFVLLTKVTPGIGLLWFAIRRRWRDLAIALGVTARDRRRSRSSSTRICWLDYLAF